MQNVNVQARRCLEKTDICEETSIIIETAQSRWPTQHPDWMCGCMTYRAALKTQPVLWQAFFYICFSTPVGSGRLQKISKGVVVVRGEGTRVGGVVGGFFGHADETVCSEWNKVWFSSLRAAAADNRDAVFKEWNMSTGTNTGWQHLLFPRTHFYTFAGHSQRHPYPFMHQR